MQSRFPHGGRKRKTSIAGSFAIVLILALSGLAQVTVGDNVNLKLSGDVSTGYTGGFGDNGSSHGLGIGGDANLSGYYYNPQFLSFDLQPFYNRSQSNSASQSITNSSGFMGNARFFSGSHYPGSVSISKTFDSTGQFGIPGAVTGLETSGSGQSIDINWSLLLPDKPTLRATYIITGNNTTVPGAEGSTHTSGRTLSLNSDYILKGFQLRGFYGHGSGHSEFPSFLTGGETGSLNNGSNYYGGTATHAIPLRGYWTVQATHSNFSTDYSNTGGAGATTGSNSSFGTSVTMNPLARLGFGVAFDYQTNAFGALQQQIIQAGGNPLRLSDNSDTYGVNASASYTISHYIFLTGQVSHREQNFGSRHFAITQYGGALSMSYAKRLLGSLHFSVGANDTATEQGNSGASLFTNVNFVRRFHAWDVTSNFNYSQSVQTQYLLYTTSMYGYGAGVSRKVGDDFHWGVTYIGNHSGLQRVEGSTSHANTISTYVNYRRYNLNALYSQTGGISVLTSGGLIPVPVGTPPPLLADALLFNAKSYGGGVGATLKRFNLIASYGRAFSDLSNSQGLNNNSSTLLNIRLRYRVRKMYFDSGFTKFQQSIGAAGGKPVVINSFYVGISRWFNVF